ncbi:MAG: hypothetical protein M3R60_05870 [Pseudomonadota bacterium]|nr:hypothetical protein [Pseudomonadota bacterium]
MIDAEVQGLAESLESASEFLLKYGVPSWASWLAKDARFVRNGDFYGVEHLLSAFGGMGSLNDLVHHPTNGHSIPEADVSRVNEELQAMLSDINDRARKLACEAGR